jgi:DNA/RNA-binding domain of Phe-tRNA-synthetase-like protein
VTRRIRHRPGPGRPREYITARHEGYGGGRDSAVVRIVVERSLQDRFPGLAAHLIEIDRLQIRARDDKLDAFAEALVKDFRERLVLDSLRDEPTIRAYRDFYWRVGIDPTKIRPASEALLRRILQGKDLPRINTLVDAYNLASMKSRVAIAAFDLGQLNGDLTMRAARSGESFHGIGMERPAILRGVEVVVQDANRLVAIYPYRDSDDTKVTIGTTAALFMTCGVPGVPEEKLAEADATTREIVTRFCL